MYDNVIVDLIFTGYVNHLKIVQEENLMHLCLLTIFIIRKNRIGLVC